MNVPLTKGQTPPAPDPAYANAAGRKALVGQSIDVALSRLVGFHCDLFHNASKAQIRAVKACRTLGPNQVVLFVKGGVVMEVL